MTSKNNKCEKLWISLWFAEYLKSCLLSPQAKKLLLALLLIQQNEEDRWAKDGRLKVNEFRPYSEILPRR